MGAVRRIRLGLLSIISPRANPRKVGSNRTGFGAMGSRSAHSSADDQLSLSDHATTTFSRRQLLGRSAVALGGITATGLLDPNSVLGSTTAAPRPIPGGLDLTTFGFVPTGADVHF